jgi:hypothetical protein
LCALCQDGYYETADHTCSLCEGGTRNAYAYFVSMSILFALAATVIFIGFGFTGRVYLLDDTRAVYKLEEKKRAVRTTKWTKGDHFITEGTVGAGIIGVTKVTARDFGTGGVEDEADHAAAQLERTANLQAMRTAGAGRVGQSPAQAAAEYQRELERAKAKFPGQTSDGGSPTGVSPVVSPVSASRSLVPLITIQSDASPPVSPTPGSNGSGNGGTRTSQIAVAGATAVGGNAMDMSSPESAAAAFKALSALADQRRAAAAAVAAAAASGSGATGTRDDDDDDTLLTGGKTSPLPELPSSPSSPSSTNGFLVPLIREGSERRLTRAARVAARRENPNAHPSDTPIVVPRGAVRRSIGNSVKIVVSFFQISTTLAFNFALPWPTAYRVFLSAFDVLNIDLVAATSASCVTPVSYYVTWAVMLIVPIALAVGLALVLWLWVQIILRCRTRNLDSKAKETERNKGKERASYVFLKLMNFSLFLLYPRLSNAALRLLSCTKVDGVHYLRADFRIHCYDPEYEPLAITTHPSNLCCNVSCVMTPNRWLKYALINVIAILLYPVGVPLLVYGLLRWARRTLTFRHPLARYALGFIYQGYKAEV